MNVAIIEERVKKVAIDDVVNALFKLPSEQIMTVYDFILFLQMRHGQLIDESDSWTEEDLTELIDNSNKPGTNALIIVHFQ